MDQLAMYLSDISKYKELSIERQVELSRRIVEGDVKARSELINHHLWFVVNVAIKYMGKGLGMMDLIQEGNEGLMDAVDRYDYRRSVKFTTYAEFWIAQRIRAALRNSYKHNTVSLDDFDEDGKSLADTMESDDVVEDNVDELLMAVNLKNAMTKSLDKRERIILKHRFGLFNSRRMTLEELGVKFCITKERIRQIEGEAINKLKPELLEMGLKGIL